MLLLLVLGSVCIADAQTLKQPINDIVLQKTLVCLSYRQVQARLTGKFNQFKLAYQNRAVAAKERA